MSVDININSKIVYVKGTVNGKPIEFENLGPHDLLTDIEQSDDDKYVLDLELMDEAGNISTYKNTFEFILPLFVYDRTRSDVERVKYLNQAYLDGTITEEEKQEWNTGINGKLGLKGAFNLSDIKRNENNCKVLGELLAVAVDIKEWQYGDIPRVSDYVRIRDNVRKIRSAFIVHADTPEVPEHPLNTYQKWNDIEKILHDVYYIYVALKNSYYYCGDNMYAGEGIGVL
ncbi:MAG: hypothetical protein NC094_12115 [Bacteroidales bacterium]|nr:hypothetical protein [Lachnoclostridium sp.]MCM1385259.1 hypothetical protein [Lachnoclostridium sp.]MCM1466155.1 hypothetical protein [Bacteroidales bacterium]